MLLYLFPDSLLKPALPARLLGGDEIGILIGKCDWYNVSMLYLHHFFTFLAEQSWLLNCVHSEFFSREPGLAIQLC
jgi:hypothetical protein